MALIVFFLVISIIMTTYQRYSSHFLMASYIQRSTDRGPLKTCKNKETGSKYWSSVYLNMQMKCKVSLKRKRIYTHSFELGSVSLDLYPLPRSKWVRWPGLDGLWSASPGRWRSEKNELCCYSCCQKTEMVTPNALCLVMNKSVCSLCITPLLVTCPPSQVI